MGEELVKMTFPVPLAGWPFPGTLGDSVRSGFASYQT